VRVYDEEAIGLLRGAGANVDDGNLVRIPGSRIEWAARAAPHQIAVYSRHGEPAMHLAGAALLRDRVGHGERDRSADRPAASGHPSGCRRFRPAGGRAAQLALRHVHGVASDFDPAVAELRHFVAMVANTAKPIVYTATDLQMARRQLQMAELVAGGAQAFRQRPFAVLYIEPISPSASQRNHAELLFAAEKGIPVSSCLHDERRLRARDPCR